MMAEDPMAEDVAEACADALLAASAQVLILRDPAQTVSLGAARTLAIQMVDRILARTVEEGPRARGVDHG